MNTVVNVSHEIVVAVDVGTTKVCAIAGRKNEYGKVEILAVGKVECDGVTRGMVTNIERTSKAIADAVEIIERKINSRVKHVHVGIAGQHIKSVKHRGILVRDSLINEINKEDIKKLINDMHKLVLPPGDKIIHVLPQEYTVDSEPGIKDPIGMSGMRLEANFHIITGQDAASTNLIKCFEKSGIQVHQLIMESLASAKAVLTEEEKEAGVALIDIGGGTTDLTIYYDSIVRHTAVVPFGGNVVTKDIKEGCTVMPNQAEKLKVKFGSALAMEIKDNRTITIPGIKGREDKAISEKNLAWIIQSRLEEILDYIILEIQRSGYENKLIGGIVITGGGSLIKDIELLCEYHTGYHTRIGLPIEHLAHGYAEQYSNPIYATAVGLLIDGLEHEAYGGVEPKVHEPNKVPMEVVNQGTSTTEKYKGEQLTLDELLEKPKSEKKPNILNGILQRTKEWFEADSGDADFK
ncbi:MAG: cell division protein FtsA [Saprospiraceae bacterium]|jgi:cell division protein FtsA|nr:cell division protein FtsA [Saprospiraceae bacterium]MBL0189981.1 cell division protein FtsA [Saprospiraceae bacterium]MBL0294721.1 cell division protein FtsA [Saprospiraceae bacterium]